jgi:hypothetical protein
LVMNRVIIIVLHVNRKEASRNLVIGLNGS